jgi:transposase, IS30 family
MRPYRQINNTERLVIKNMYYGGKSKAGIAKTLNRHRSSIYRELSRNKTKAYHDKEAQELSEKRQSKRFRRLDTNGILRQVVCTLLIDKNSPEVISFYLKDMFPKDHSMHISHESIYTWIYEQRDYNGKYILTRYLFTHRRKRQNRSNIYKKRAKDLSKKTIRERPKEANERSEAGHLEGDLIVSSGGNAYLLTLVDRKNINTWGVYLPSKDANTVTRAITETLENLPRDYVKSITFDNGTEFSMHQEIEKALSCKVYYADPYTAWQRGLNEHINGRIRQYLPKKKSFAGLTDEAVASILFAINNRPRKSLGWKSPVELFLTDLVALDP